MHLGEKLPCDAKERDADALSFYRVTMFASLVSCANSGTRQSIFCSSQINSVSFAALQDFGRDTFIFRCFARVKEIKILV